MALWIYSGYEQLSTVTEEVEMPARNFPRGLAITIPLAIVTFLLPIAAGLVALGNWKDWDTGYIVTASRLVGGPWLAGAMFIAAAVSTFGLLQSTVLSATRLPFAMSEDGFFHPALSKLHDKYQTPARAILVSAIACGGLALFSLTQLIAVYAWLRVATSVLTLLSVWRLRKVAPGLKRDFVIPGGRMGLGLVVAVPICLFAWALINSDPAARVWGLLYLAAGPVAYALLPKNEELLKLKLLAEDSEAAVN